MKAIPSYIVIKWLLLFILCSSCSSLEMNNETAINPDDIKDKGIHDVIASTAYILKKEKNLFLFGNGARAMDEVKKLSLYFFYYDTVSMVESRELLLYSVDTFIDQINKNESLRPFLESYPFTPAQIEVNIIFKKSDGSEVPPDALCIVKLFQNKVKYLLLEEKIPDLITIYEEPYEEALERKYISLEECMKTINRS